MTSKGPNQSQTEYTLSTRYEPSEFEEKISKMWLDSGGFHAKPNHDQKPYVIMMPLPNITGALHMGHAMDNVMQDMLIRWHRMQGDNALWMPGTDHAGIATQAVVEKRLKELEGLTRHDVGRQGLIERIWKWKDQFQIRIVEQQQRMGCSADWNRQRFTMDKVCSKAVRTTFFRMFEDGLIFRGKRLVNWDSFLLTSISDDEVYYETVKGHFWHLSYPVIDPEENDPREVIVATTRPETMLGDTAVAVHPDPEGALKTEIKRLKEQIVKSPQKVRQVLEKELVELKLRQKELLPGLIHLRNMARNGRQVMLPLMNRAIPLLCDEWAKPSLGSGLVKITPAHDYNDYDVWLRHREKIDIINILNPDGTMNQNTGKYAGLDCYEAREHVLRDLEEQGRLTLVEDRQIEIGHSDRSKTPIEPYISDQWFIFMGDRQDGVVMGRGTAKEHKSQGLIQAAIDAARDGRVKFHPERFLKTYLDWLEEKRDWPISRQLWWGHRIPVWSVAVALSELPELVRKVFKELSSLHPEKALVRTIQKEEGRSTLINGHSDLDKLKGQASDVYLVDVCFLENNTDCINRLTKLGFKQDPDVLDTWFSSAIWPHSTLGWPDPENAETEKSSPLGAFNNQPDCLEFYYPGSCLVTGRDIITLWVARMVLSGLYNMGDIPFSDVFIHANILDGKGERMSKSKGNGIDPVDIIEAYGTDAMRYVLCDMQTGNQDIRLPVTAVCPSCEKHNELAKTKHGKSVFTFVCSQCKTEFDVLGTMPGIPAAKLVSERFNEGSRFCNKLWNASRFALGNLINVPKSTLTTDQLELEDRWILSSLNQTIRVVTKWLKNYNPSNALGAARDFMWGDLCDWYLELVKPRLSKRGSPSAAIAQQVVAHCLDQTLRLLHPFVPFITEYLYQQLCIQVPERGLSDLSDKGVTSKMLLNSTWPKPIETLDDEHLIKTFADLQKATSGVREVRATQGVSPKKPVDVTIRPPKERSSDLKSQAHVIKHLANIDQLTVDPRAKRPKGAASLVIGDLPIFVHDMVNDEEERNRLQNRMKQVENEIGNCQKRLSNKNFVTRAPFEVVEQLQQKLIQHKNQKEAIIQALAEL